MTARAAALAFLCALPAGAAAQIAVLDDSESPRQQVLATFDWVVDDVAGTTDLDALLRQRADVNGVQYRFDTSGFVGLPVRIFLEFPRDVTGLDRGGSAMLQWRTRGNFIAGTVRQGERVLVFDGVVPSPRMSDVFDFVVTIDVRDVTGPLRLAPRFVLETQ